MSTQSIKHSRPIVGIVMILIALTSINFLAYSLMNEPKVELLQTSNPNQLADITGYLDAHFISYEIGSDGKTILVDKKLKNITAIELAGEGLIGFDAGPGFELFDKVQLGMTDRMFDAQYRRVLQNTLADIIENGLRIDTVKISINPGSKALFENDVVAPSATVKVITQRDLNLANIKGIQYLVASAVSGMKPGNVIVIDKSNQSISENAIHETE